ncbi:MAG: thioredoxin domain-containing protein [Parvicellaceae bacterium]
MKKSNLLIKETSPYLLQHAYNPVNWHPWNKQALEKAKNENKMLIISIGYSACHWCHVMEKESFQDVEIASLMNDNFICIKIDKEERPDIDLIYMEAVQLITGQGGWPLNCITLPNGKPIYGGTYFNKKQWSYTLTQLVNIYKNESKKVNAQANKLAEAISKNEFIDLEIKVENNFNSLISSSIEKWKSKLDPIYGGLRGAPKFPMPSATLFLLVYNYYKNDSTIEAAITTHLEKMHFGGIYDHIIGGFCRYSTDEKWKVPHFEKMLYDNAQLLSLYATAYKISSLSAYKEIVLETISFLASELANNKGGYYCAIDADSEGEEGKYYSWGYEEINDVIDNQILAAYFNISKEGNWESDTNILYISKSKETFCKEFSIGENEFEESIQTVKKKLNHFRSKRIKPQIDNKLITSWNALLLTGLIDSYSITHNEELLEKSIALGEFLTKNSIKKDFSLIRIINKSNAPIDGFLDDYAFVIKGFISLYQTTFDEKWLNMANSILDYAIENFSDEASQLFFYTHKKSDSLIARKMELTDNVIPSSNSQMALNLFLIGTLLDKQKHIERAKTMSQHIIAFFKENGAYYSNWGILLTWLNSPPFQVAIVGKKALSFKNKLAEFFLPNVIILGSTKPSDLPLLAHKYQKEETYFYICQNNTCLPPLTSIESVINKVNLSN